MSVLLNRKYLTFLGPHPRKILKCGCRRALFTARIERSRDFSRHPVTKSGKINKIFILVSKCGSACQSQIKQIELSCRVDKASGVEISGRPSGNRRNVCKTETRSSRPVYWLVVIINLEGAEMLLIMKHFWRGLTQLDRGRSI